eukprot:5465513-Pyramimonas_sp.AAC.1
MFVQRLNKCTGEVEWVVTGGGDAAEEEEEGEDTSLRVGDAFRRGPCDCSMNQARMSRKSGESYNRTHTTHAGGCVIVPRHAERREEKRR